MRSTLAIAFVLLALGDGHAEAISSTSEISRLIDEAGLSAGVPIIDVAVTGSANLCYAGRFERESGIILRGKHDKSPPGFHSASISKLFTAVVIMQLRDEGKLLLDDRVGQYVPAFNLHEIRLKHLLTHTSGLRDRKRANGRTSHEDVDAYINSLARQKISRKPGTTWRYSDAGFNLLGRVIENVTGESFSTVLRDRLLSPLGMEDSSFEVSRIPADRLAPGFNKRGRQLQHPWDRAFLPSSGLQTNASDLAQFARAVLRVNAGIEDPEFLSFETLREMTTVRTATKWDGIAQGYAWQISKSGSETVWRHAGGEAGFETLLSVYPDTGIGIVALGNREGWPRFRLVGQIRDTLANAHDELCNH